METLNPFAYAKGGRIVTAWESTRDEGPFTCPGCSEQLDLKKGSVKRHHFAHRGGECQGGRGGESQTHVNAKIWMAQHIDKWTFIDTVTCVRHPRVHRFSSTSASTETPCLSYFLDVGVYTDDVLVGGVEIMHTHATGESKGLALAAVLSQPIIEVAADDVLGCAQEGRWEINCKNIWSHHAACSKCAVIAAAAAAAAQLAADEKRAAVAAHAYAALADEKRRAAATATQSLTRQKPTANWESWSLAEKKAWNDRVVADAYAERDAHRARAFGATYQ